MIQKEETFRLAAAKAGMDEKTARRYRRLGKAPSEVKVEHNWRTHEDKFAEVWSAIADKLSLAPGLEAKTLFLDLQRRFPGCFSDGQLRTFQRRVKVWRATEGPGREVYFAQIHRPGELSQSDFTCMNALRITINGQAFDHLLYHFVLPYSDWEDATVCFSESFESLSEGLQNALWKLGGVPRVHRTDQLSAAVHQLKKNGQEGKEGEEFTQRYSGLLRHYGLFKAKIQAGKAHENGDVEQRNHRLKRAVEQALLLRGSRDFESRQAYVRFLRKVLDQQNAGRRKRLAEELKLVRRLPACRLPACRHEQSRVGQGSTIRVQNNLYSVPSRLIGELVEVRIYAEKLEVWYGQRRVEELPRLRGRCKVHINYRHLIDWLVRKPGAFANYRYREELFPSSHFRMAYDELLARQPATASKEYLLILQLAAQESEAGVEQVLRFFFEQGKPITAKAVGQALKAEQEIPPATDIDIAAVDLNRYDQLLEMSHGASC